MSEYTPGSAYDAGYQSRMKGGAKPSNTMMTENNVYWEEWLAGWGDAHEKIINEGRSRNTNLPGKCCKNFIQD